MNEQNYAFIKNGLVVNVVVFDNPSEQVLDSFIEQFNLDEIILANYNSAVGGSYDGVRFWLPQPYLSWVKNEETNQWDPPIPYPTDIENYIWDENTTSWLLLPPSN